MTTNRTHDANPANQVSDTERAAADPAPNNSGPDIQVHMKCELSQENPEQPFEATLIREETRYWDDDPKPEIVETIIAETELDSPLPAVFAAVDLWLTASHHLRMVPSSWRPGITGPSTGYVVLLEGQAAPTDAIPA
ncbi:hypothetical protein [Mycobacterium sp. 1245111.1]|uniref:hypothetical protein n=1 Tax=Mycobacterium sp. 1245111.1 TaxID=1834073 RepID=UPI000AB7191C|nr:hypothetical protein [Mycobacterium sp. 1245111.1]